MHKLPRWDIFCRVVDNYGDIGVCWRIARALAHEHGASVRLWVDDLEILHALWPDADPVRERQQVDGIDVCHWTDPLPRIEPACAVIEAFGCGLPAAYAEAFASRGRQSVWIVLEYLSAESWVKTHHGLPSPHPRLPVTRIYVCPGFEAGTGGVPVEAGLAARRGAFDESARRAFWNGLGFRTPDVGMLVMSLFAYAHAPVRELLEELERGPDPVVLAVPEGKVTAGVLEYLGNGVSQNSRAMSRGNLEVRLLPFLPQPRYDELLWACDLNFVRGEDSFVRAQLAARPLVWQPYPQQENAHLRKLDAFLDLYCAGLPAPAAAAVRETWSAWTAAGPAHFAAAWRAFREQRTALAVHARAWSERIAALGSLTARLAQLHPDGLK